MIEQLIIDITSVGSHVIFQFLFLGKTHSAYRTGIPLLTLKFELLRFPELARMILKTLTISRK